MSGVRRCVSDPWRDRREKQLLRLVDDAVEITWPSCQHAAPTERKQVVRQTRAPLGCFQDHLERLRDGPWRHVRERELSMTHDRRQPIVEIVSDAARHLSGGLQSLQVTNLLFECAALLCQRCRLLIERVALTD